jgi:hypothetical protein
VSSSASVLFLDVVSGVPRWAFRLSVLQLGTVFQPTFAIAAFYPYGVSASFFFTNIRNINVQIIRIMQPTSSLSFEDMFPLDLWVERDAESKQWRFGFQRPIDAVVQWGTDTLEDNRLLYVNPVAYARSGFTDPVMNFSKLQIALATEASSTIDASATFHSVSIFTKQALDKVAAYNQYWSPRMATAGQKFCPIQHDLVAQVPVTHLLYAQQRNASLIDLQNGLATRNRTSSEVSNADFVTKALLSSSGWRSPTNGTGSQIDAIETSATNTTLVLKRSLSWNAMTKGYRYALRSVLPNVPYRVSVAAISAAGVVGQPVEVDESFLLRPSLPVSGAILFADANSIPAGSPDIFPNGTLLRRFQDISPHGLTSNATFESPIFSEPFILGKTMQKPYQRLQFRRTKSNGRGVFMEYTGNSSVFALDAGYASHEMTIFVLYQPATPPTFPTPILSTDDMGAVVGCGGSFVRNGPGWAVSSSSFRRQKPVRPSETSLYEWSYGARWIAGSMVNAKNFAVVGNSFGELGPWLSKTRKHPHSDAPTLMTYQYSRSSLSSKAFRADACRGLNRGTREDACSFPLTESIGNATGGATVSANNPFSDILFHESSTYEFTTFSGQTVDFAETEFSDGFPVGKEPLVLGASSGIYYLNREYTEYFTGDLHAVVIYKRALSQPERHAVQRYLGQRYNVLCPAISPGIGTIGTCPESAHGDSCTLQCAAQVTPSGRTIDFSRTDGLTTLVCKDGAWIGKALVCSAQCPPISIPPMASTCSKVYHSNRFSAYPPGTPFSALSTYELFPRTATAIADELWYVTDSGTLLGSVPPTEDQCGSVMHSQPSGFIVNNPGWLTGLPYWENLTVTASFRMFDGPSQQAGLIVRVQSNGSHYRILLSTSAGLEIWRFTNGSLSVVATSNTRTWLPKRTGIDPNTATWTKLQVTYGLKSLSDLTVVFTVFVNDILAGVFADSLEMAGDLGSSGIFVANGTVEVDAFAITGSCDRGGTSCRKMYAAQQCNIACRQGYSYPRDGIATCGADGEWIGGSELVCIPDKPSIEASFTFRVFEDIPAGSVIGTVRALTSLAQQKVFFSIVPETNIARKVANDGSFSYVDDPFAIGICSGELVLTKNSALDAFAYTNESLSLTVRACTDGQPTACRLSQVHLSLFPVARAPRFRESSLIKRFIAENSSAGTLIEPPLVAEVLGGGEVGYSITFGNTLNIFSINNSSGYLYLIRDNTLDFESVSHFTLYIRAFHLLAPQLSSSATVTINVLDSNEPPRLTSRSTFFVSERAAAPDIRSSIQLEAIDPDMGDKVRYSFQNPVSGLAVNGTTGLISFTRLFTYDGVPGTGREEVVDGILCRERLLANVTIADARGASMVVTITIWITADLTASTAPVLSALSTPAGPRLSTLGGDLLIFSGTRLDLIRPLNLVRVAFMRKSNSTGKLTSFVTTEECALISETSFSCLSPPGVGIDIEVEVTYGINRTRADWLVRSPTVNYFAPVITAIEPLDPVKASLNALDTRGGAFFRVIGLHLSCTNISMSAITFRYGNFLAEPLPDHSQTIPGSAIVLRTAAGWGANLSFVYIVGDQRASSDESPLFSYKAPVVLNITTVTSASASMTSLSSAGGDMFIIRGNFFGPLQAPIRFSYGTGTSFVGLAYGEATDSFRFRFNFIASACVKESEETAHTAIRCTSSPGFGAALSVNLTIGSQSNIPSLSAKITLSYFVPVFTRLSGQALTRSDTEGGSLFSIEGRNLGPAVVDPSITVASGNGSIIGTSSIVPIQVLYGPTGVEYSAKSCQVTSDVPSKITCLSAPGRGFQNQMKITIGGVVALQGNRGAPPTLSYAPPVIYGIDRSTGLRFYVRGQLNDLATTGSEVIIVDGRNFGPMWDSFSSATYSTILTQPTYFDAIRAISGKRSLSYIATNCSFLIPHSRLRCLTIPGAGRNLEISLNVAGQESVYAMTSFAAPVITSVETLNNGSALTLDADAEETWVRIRGLNFGPSTNCVSPLQCKGFVTSLTYGITGTSERPTSFHVESHRSIIVLLGQSFGSNLYFVVSVAGVTSTIQTDCGFKCMLGFMSPTIKAISPPIGPTSSTSSSPNIVAVLGRYFSLRNPLVSVTVDFGNREDGSLQQRIFPLQSIPQRPDANVTDNLLPIPVSFNVSTGDSIIFFEVPEGLGLDRNVRVVVSSTSPQDSYIVAHSGDSYLYGYEGPEILGILFETAVVYANDLSPASMDIREKLAELFGRGWIDEPASINVISIFGRNFGPASSRGHDLLRRVVELSSALPFVASKTLAIASWDHGRIVAITQEATGYVRVRITGLAFQPPIFRSSDSNAAFFESSLPTISLLSDSTEITFGSAGGSILSFRASGLSSIVSVLRVVVGNSTCPLLAYAGATATLDTVEEIRRFVSNSSNFVDVPNAAGFNRLWTMHCRMPPGQGKNIAVSLIKDGMSAGAPAFISYAPPMIIAFAVGTQVGTGKFSWMNFTVPSALLQPGQPQMFPALSDTINVGTRGSRVRLFGSNFGMCPIVQLLSRKVVYLPQDIAACPQGGGGHLQTTNITVKHDFIEFTTLEGEGGPVNFFVRAGDQQSDVHGHIILSIRASPPVITGVSSGGSTEGGSSVMLTGMDFGLSPPIIMVGRKRCADPAFVSSTEVGTLTQKITCILPEGTGSGLTVSVTTSSATGYLQNAFSYSAPAIEKLIVQTDTLIAFRPSDGTLTATGSPAGGYSATIIGQNFGRTTNASCIFVAWRGRASSTVFSCNGLRDFIGEGEVPSFAVTSWSHRSISFIMPPGTGFRDIFVIVDGLFPPLPISWAYSAPIIADYGVSPSVFSTSGGESVTISGSFFGPRMTLQGSLNSTGMLVSSVATVSAWLEEAQPPMALLRVVWADSCAVPMVRIDGRRPSSILSEMCEEEAILEMSDSSITMASLAGIGVNRSLYIEIVDSNPVINGSRWNPLRPYREYLVASLNVDGLANNSSLLPTSTFNFGYLRSNNVFISYFPPSIDFIVDAPVRLTGRPTVEVLMMGQNFGKIPANARCSSGTPWWCVDISVGGYPCIAPEDAVPYEASTGVLARATGRRITIDGEDLLVCNMQDQIVGYKNISYTVGGQEGFTSTDSLNALLAVCAPGTFGRPPSDTCLPCPPGAFCPGFLFVSVLDSRYDIMDPQISDYRGIHFYPEPLVGFFNLNGSMGYSCPGETRQQYSGRDVCIVACDPPEACVGNNRYAFHHFCDSATSFPRESLSTAISMHSHLPVFFFDCLQVWQRLCFHIPIVPLCLMCSRFLSKVRLSYKRS